METGDIVCIKFSNENVNDQEYWDDLHTIPTSTYSPDSGGPIKGVKNEQVELTIGTIDSIDEIDVDYAHVLFKDFISKKILIADLFILP